MICCGHERTTRHCPDCGKRLRDDGSLPGLLSHLRARAKAQRSTAESHRARLIHSGHDDAYQEEQARARDASANRYDRWADQLEALLASHATPTPGPTS